MALAAVRLRIPCADAGEFLERFAPRYVSAGIFVPTDRPRPVGTRLQLKIELRDGTLAVQGEALVTGNAPAGPRPGMTLRLTRLDPGSVSFDLSPVGETAPPVAPGAAAPRARLEEHLFGGSEPVPEARGAERPLEVKTSQVKLRMQGSAPRRVEEAVEAQGEPEEVAPDELEPLSSEQALPARRAPRRLGRVAAGALLAAAVAAVAVALLLQRRADAREAAVAEAVRAADARVREGRLSGPGDSALDRLAAARELAPADPRVVTRLRLLADKFEELGARALSRGQPAEAAANYAAAVRAEPWRQEARRRLREIEGGGSGPPAR